MISAATAPGRGFFPIFVIPIVVLPILFVTRRQYKPDHHNTATLFQAGEVNTFKFEGGSALKAIEALEGVGLTVEHVVVLIDREQGAGEILAEKGYRLHAALQMSEILHVLHESGQITAKQVTTVQNFLKANAASPAD